MTIWIHVIVSLRTFCKSSVCMGELMYLYMPLMYLKYLLWLVAKNFNKLS
jgi:hypothetical protein